MRWFVVAGAGLLAATGCETTKDVEFTGTTTTTATQDGGAGGVGGSGGAATGSSGGGGSGAASTGGAGGVCQPSACEPWDCGAAVPDGCGSTLDCSATVCGPDPVSAWCQGGLCTCNLLPPMSEEWRACNVYPANGSGPWCNYGQPGQSNGNCDALVCGDDPGPSVLYPGCAVFLSWTGAQIVCCQPGWGP